MRRAHRVAAFAGALSIFTTSAAWGVTQPTALATHVGLESASGNALRAQRSIGWYKVPRAAARAYARFVAEVGPSFLSSWDETTGVPSQLWGAGVAAPGSVASAATAEAFARGFLSRHLALLAPGASIDDFVLAANDLDLGLRTVGFVQQHAGMPVIGGQLSFRFKSDRMFVIASQALPSVHVDLPSKTVDPALARSSAASWILADAAGKATPSTIEGPFVLPLVGASGGISYEVVERVTVDANAPTSRWSVYVDAVTGAPVAREQTLKFAQGTLYYNAPVRWPGGQRVDYPALYVDGTVNGAPVTSDENGVLAFASAPGDVVAQAVGPRVKVANDAGAAATKTFSVPDGGTAVWNAATDAEVDAQLNSFIHAHDVRNYTKLIAPSMAFLNQQVQVTVNINDTCNAFSDGDTINFFHAGGGCENTGRLADVVYHEFGHSFHYHAVIQGVGEFESALSEGQSDYLSATITNDPAMGIGFFFDSSPLRQIDPLSKEYVWPDDVEQDPHGTGLIIAGALWDMRKLLVQSLGDAEGVKVSDQLYYQGIRRAVDIPSMYIEVLTGDDDDGDLSNGTPHACEIAEAFGAHGLRTVTVESGGGLAAETPTKDGYKVSLKVVGLFAQCAGVGTAKIDWRLRETPTTSGTIDMTPQAGLFEGVIPAQKAGQVVEYQVNLALQDGSTLTFPDNAADPRYQFFVGEVENIYCTDFEKDPAAEGWTHGLTAGDPGDGADDWQWGAVQATPGSGDPIDAYSGTKVFGNDLGGGKFNGQYQADHTNFALSPSIKVDGKTNVRLQYRRWLNVEDAHFDKATIYANDQLAWQNLDSNMGDQSSMQHTDKEWRFQDVDLTPFVKDGAVQIKYEIASDPGLEMGGWTLDDFCVVAFTPPVDPTCDEDPTQPECQQGSGGSGPAGVTSSGAGTPATPKSNAPEEDSGCGCRVVGNDDAGSGAALLAIGAALAIGARRRRRQ